MYEGTITATADSGETLEWRRDAPDGEDDEAAVEIRGSDYMRFEILTKLYDCGYKFVPFGYLLAIETPHAFYLAAEECGFNAKAEPELDWPDELTPPTDPNGGVEPVLSNGMTPSELGLVYEDGEWVEPAA